MISDTYIPLISYSDISPWTLSYFLSYQSLIITFFYPIHPTVTHDLTSLSIRKRRGSVLDHFGCTFIHILDFKFNIFHNGRTWQIVDLLVTMFSLWQLACWVLICLHFVFWALIITVLSISYFCFVSMVSRCMVLFGITYLSLGIFITWWMSIFQSTVILRHCVSQSVHCHILGHPHSLGSSDLP